MPSAALVNDLMIYYPPALLYEEKVTVMVMICASVCITSMICFTLERKHREYRALDAELGADYFRMAARGNAASFLLPWEDMLNQLHNADHMDDLGNMVSLPRTGMDLANIMSILLKIASDSDDGNKATAKMIHQATVRRSVVIRLIEHSHSRGHRAYRHMNMDNIMQTTLHLPVNGVPPEMIRLLPQDDTLDKIQMQKNATPVPIAKTDEEAIFNL